MVNDLLVVVDPLVVGVVCVPVGRIGEVDRDVAGLVVHPTAGNRCSVLAVGLIQHVIAEVWRCRPARGVDVMDGVDDRLYRAVRFIADSFDVVVWVVPADLDMVLGDVARANVEVDPAVRVEAEEALADRRSVRRTRHGPNRVGRPRRRVAVPRLQDDGAIERIHRLVGERHADGGNRILGDHIVLGKVVADEGERAEELGVRAGAGLAPVRPSVLLAVVVRIVAAAAGGVGVVEVFVPVLHKVVVGRDLAEVAASGARDSVGAEVVESRAVGEVVPDV